MPLKQPSDVVGMPEVRAYAHRMAVMLEYAAAHLIVTSVTLPRHHGDPVDGIPFAHVLHEGVSILSLDRVPRLYGVPVIWQ